MAGFLFLVARNEANIEPVCRRIEGLGRVQITLERGF